MNGWFEMYKKGIINMKELMEAFEKHQKKGEEE